MAEFAKKKFIWLVLLGVLVIGAAFYFASPKSAPLIYAVSQGGSWFLPILVLAALADSVNPCAFSILLITIAFLFSMGKSRREIFKIGGSYIAGIFAIYVLIGLGILQALHLFNTPHFMAKVGATILILFGGINLVNEFFPSFPIKLRIPKGTHAMMAKFMNKGSALTAFVLGGLVGLCEFPCTGGPYLAVLGFLHDQSKYILGLGYLALYNLIFISPLVVILLVASDSFLLGKVEKWKKENMRNIRLYGGIAMVLLGIAMFLI